MANNSVQTCQSGFISALNVGASINTARGQTTTIGTLVGAIAASLVAFGVQILIFGILRVRLSRIYRPKSYLVPERERVPPPPSGLYQWLTPIFTTSSLTIIQRCGLDAYFFLRFLRTLLKFFFPVAVIALPILLPINHASGDGVKEGLDTLTMGNVANQYTSSRLWAHLIIAVGIIAWFCYLIYHELRGYIRVRQAYLTSPQHRIRASATTVLVTGIPRKWLTLEALSGLYDVFPGGIKNIWINRNFDKLTQKVKERNGIADQLEAAEMRLIQLCWKKHEKAEKIEAKKAGKVKSRKERKKDEVKENDAAERMAEGHGRSAGEHVASPQQGHEDVLHPAEETDTLARNQSKRRRENPLSLVNQGLGAVGHGVGALSRGVGTAGQKVVGDVDAGFLHAGEGINHISEKANAGMGFSTDDELYRDPVVGQDNHAPGQAATYTTHLPTIAGPIGGDSRAVQAHPFASRSNPIAESSASMNNQASPEAPTKQSWQFWKDHDGAIRVPSPEPQQADDKYPLRGSTDVKDVSGNDKRKGDGEGSPRQGYSSEEDKPPSKHNGTHSYPTAFNSDFDEDQDGDARWRLYIEPEDRETMRMPVFGVRWCPRLPLIGTKIDRIYWLRRELARLNMEIEHDQNDIHQFPFMTSAFVQFNHQVAAHMACQAVSHHVPQYMSPRLVEISPSDIIWDNMSVKWWERHLRTLIVLAVCIGMIILFIPPVGFTSLLSNVGQLAQTYCWLGWLKGLNSISTAIIQGILPAVLLSLILLIVPIIFRILIKQQGVPTGNDQELAVQNWYFAFLFIVVFLVVTLTKGITSFLSDIAKNPVDIASNLANSLPGAVNYFYNYLLVQSLGNSAGALLQVFTLLQWFVFAPLGSATPRSKWKQQTELSTVDWGSFFPPFANFAVIGIIYSAIAPLILVFMLIIFGVFWVAYRYNVIYVYRFRHDTGGLLFPTAINQLFVGIYFLELCLIGLFFLSRNQYQEASCIPQGSVMVAVLVLTVLYHWQLNATFKPLYRYLPVTLEDEAVMRDDEFARAQASKFAPLQAQASDVNDGGELDAAEETAEHSRTTEPGEGDELDHTVSAESEGSRKMESSSETGQKRRWSHDARGVGRLRRGGPDAIARLKHPGILSHGKGPPPSRSPHHDVEAQRTVGDVLYSGFAEDLEDLSPEDRDMLVRYSFQHSALRARRPVVWIPRDRLGVSDDEVRRAERMSTVEATDEHGHAESNTYIWMSNDGTALDAKGRAVFRRSPPDFSNVDLIEL